MSNRPFEIVDHYVNYKFLALIIKKIKENPNRKVIILDLGGGVESKTARGILGHPFLKGKVKVINSDLFARQISQEELEAEGINKEDILITNEDFSIDRSIEDNSVDAIISYQVLDNIGDKKLIPTLENAARVLAPGGEAYMDEMWRITRGTGFGGPFMVFPGLLQSGGALQGIANRQNVLISSTHRETTLDGRTFIFGAGFGMIYMAKPYTKGVYDFPNVNDFNLSFPEISEALKDYGVKLPGEEK